MTLKITPRIGEFSSPDIPLEEVKAFYTMDGCIQQAQDRHVTRPYAWSNSVTTLDGYIHFYEEDSKDVSDIALKNVDGIGHLSTADWRLLNAGWSFADAVMISGQILRDEPHAQCTISFQDLIDFRCSVLGKPCKQPLQLILSNSCNIDYETHPLLNHPDLCVVILTSPEGKVKSEAELRKRQSSQPTTKRSRLNTLYHPNEPFVPRPGTITLVEFPTSSDQNALDLTQILNWLSQKAGIRNLDVSAGGTIIRQLIDLKCLDEIRMTQTGQIIGAYNTDGIERPPLFPTTVMGKRYTVADSPLVAWKGIRTIGEHFVFLRGVLTYRH
ncbi:hypothetical protein HDV05_001139 [Chytridiales sp. JEL 0842]|nr:hypothetical protein HDV05_001139 [Chytridiales sp. JEL 0842]